MVPRDDPAFLNWINLWLHQMKLDGELDRLRERWITPYQSLWAGRMLDLKRRIEGAPAGARAEEKVE